MAINIAPKSVDIELEHLLREVGTGEAQLPEFQRDWTWDDGRIRGILASLSQGYPMGAIMRLEYGNESVKFKSRLFEGVEVDKVSQVRPPSFLLLDGQQRLTSMYRATKASLPVTTKNEKGKEIQRYYYFDMKACLDETQDRYDAVVPVPEDKIIRAEFNRQIVLDLSNKENEFEQEMFPINIIFDTNELMKWADGYKDYHNYEEKYKKRFNQFYAEVIETITKYRLPVITLGKETPREAVCKVFENVNTGGVSLTVFELVTATFATYEFDLRKDWEVCRDKIWGKGENLVTDVMYGINETSFLTTITLYSSFLSDKVTTCKKKDVLALSFEEYIKNKEAVITGFKLARKFLLSQYVFRMRDLPYNTQLIPLAAICAVIGESVFNQPNTQKILAQWYWCGIMGEMYGGANESRYVNDIEDVVALIKGNPSANKTINTAYFSASRLISLQTRNSAAYKGIMALVYREKCMDFMQGTTMEIVKSMDENPDIHHIFPEAFCVKNNLPRSKWNSIINKTPLLPASNRQIGGDAPSKYIQKIRRAAQIDDADLRQRIESHLINYEAFIQDDFDSYFIDRAKELLKVIEVAMGKAISDKNSEQTIQMYGQSLADTE